MESNIVNQVATCCSCTPWLGKLVTELPSLLTKMNYNDINSIDLVDNLSHNDLFSSTKTPQIVQCTFIQQSWC